ncbi:hypothetical protein HYU09_02560 [Candidatus Woesearchaeota archaeon]|nr:hypothetical protein [Candidatus Woesearchaeota archaeon]
MGIRIKKRNILFSLMALILISGLFLALKANYAAAVCSGSDLWSLKIYDPSRNLVRNSSIITITPTGGVECDTPTTVSTNLDVSCQTSGTYVANVTCYGCAVMSNVADTNVITCQAPNANRLIIKNSTGGNIAAFDEKGYVYLRGFNYSNQAVLNPNQNSYVFMNNTGKVVAYINSSGDLMLAGSVSMSQATVSAPLNSFIIRNDTRKDVAYIDSSGNLVLSGVIYHNWTDTI